MNATEALEPISTMTIDGKAIVAEKGEVFDVVNPANEQVIGKVPNCTVGQLDYAVGAARCAFAAWSITSSADRRLYLNKMADRIVEHCEPLKMLLTSEQGKCLADAELEILSVTRTLRATASLELPVEQIESDETLCIETRHVPIGVVAAIPPWNFPLTLASMKFAPALMTGNTVVLKPSPFTPLSTLYIGKITRDIFPPGVFNVISGSDRLGPWLTEHSGVDKISFTGSTQVGRKVMLAAAKDLKRLTLELGGNDPMIVLPDIDVEAVVEKIFWAAFRNAGQICVATKRLYIHQDIYDRLASALVAYAGTVKIGDGAAVGTQIGPINNRAQYERILNLFADVKDSGYTILTGGEPMVGPGFFLPITLVDNPPERSRVVQEEQFGPILPLLKFRTIDEAISRANASDYGLGASVWSADPERAKDVGQRLISGTVWINQAPTVHPLASFGGHKQSGFGSEGGLDGLRAYTLAKTFFVRKN
jgi:acyl-CoA reductase-like NAD-dependent aldehyde dehydrogenase